MDTITLNKQGRIQGANPARAPLKLEKNMIFWPFPLSGADPGFQVRGGALKKIALSEGRREKFWGISC
jgi:hypothetical protein